MHDARSPILTPWLHCLVMFSLGSVVFTAILVWIGHSFLGEMRPLDGLLVIGVASLAGLVALVVVARFVMRGARRIRS